MKNEIEIRLSDRSVGYNLAEYLAQAGYPLHADCGGKGRCGKCRVRLISGTLYLDAACTHPAPPDADGMLLSCRVYGKGQAVIALPVQKGEGLTDFADQKRSLTQPDTPDGVNLGMALDIGTTTLAAALIDLHSGRVLATTSRHNPQSAFGADVMSRIEAAGRDAQNLVQMQALLLSDVRAMMAELSPTRPISHISAVGNTTMLHILCGISPVSMGTYPFTPQFTNARELDGASLGLDVARVSVLPSASAFIGADAVAGALLCDLFSSPDPAMLVDIGTNGECVLFTGTRHGGRTLAASAAAGPALEGAGISTGMGGVPGAVCAVRLQKNQPVCTTVGDLPAIGICGSGLIDLIAALYKAGYIDETGAFEQGDHFVYATTANGTPLSITQADIRAFQLAKSALRAAIETLCATAGIAATELGALYLAGGLGYYMNTEAAVATGLLPGGLDGKIHSVGNAALGGACRALTDPAAQTALAAQVRDYQTVELSTSAVWNEAFMMHIMFPDKEDEI